MGDITDDDLRVRFLEGVRNVAALCLQIGYPTAASVPHSIANGFKNVMAIAVATDIEFPEGAQVKAYLADPSAFAVAAPAAAAGVMRPRKRPRRRSPRRSRMKTWDSD